MRHLGFAVPVAILLVVACGATDQSTFVEEDLDSGITTPTADGAISSSDAATGPIFEEDASSAPPTCESKVLCGSGGTCCKVGEECYEGVCTAACATGIHCGAKCCDANTVCISDTCTAPGIACLDSFDCEETEFCEPSISKCLPQPTGASACQYKPPVLPLEPILEWSWVNSNIRPGYNQVINTPMVVDLDGDKIPEVVIVTSLSDNTAASDFGENDPAFIRVLDGKTGLEKWGPTAEAFTDGTGGSADNRVNPRATPAVGDIDGDGNLEIIALSMNGGLIAFRKDGSRLWVSTRADGITPYLGKYNSGTVALADMDNDGKVEIVVGGTVFNEKGVLTNDGMIGREHWGENAFGYGAVSIIADVDGNAATTEQYVVTGNRAMRKDGSLLWDQSVASDAGAALSDGYPAIADLDNDGVPELVVTAQGKIRVQNAITGALIEQIALPNQPTKAVGNGGPPTVADFDNDGVMEFAAAGATRYSVFEYDPKASPKITVKWSADTQDASSNVTGSSVFDFEGDGSAEVVYNDECYSRVYKGTTGDILFTVPNSSATVHEYPVLVDVDGDNNTEMVIAANDRQHIYSSGSFSCASYATYSDGGAPPQPRHGIFVYGDKNDKWVRTRKVWNQHAYHITNVNTDGTIPKIESRSWSAGLNNNYRVSAPGTGNYNAPDLTVDLEISTAACPDGLEIRARVKNKGSLGAPAGARVTFYEGTSAAGVKLGEGVTKKALLPGESEVVSLVVSTKIGSQSVYATVDGGAASTLHECTSDNNGAGAGGVKCPTTSTN